MWIAPRLRVISEGPIDFIELDRPAALPQPVDDRLAPRRGSEFNDQGARKAQRHELPVDRAAGENVEIGEAIGANDRGRAAVSPGPRPVAMMEVVPASRARRVIGYTADCNGNWLVERPNG